MSRINIRSIKCATILAQAVWCVFRLPPVFLHARGLLGRHQPTNECNFSGHFFRTSRLSHSLANSADEALRMLLVHIIFYGRWQKLASAGLALRVPVNANTGVK